jgi:hypothetical protein
MERHSHTVYRAHQYFIMMVATLGTQVLGLAFSGQGQPSKQDPSGFSMKHVRGDSSDTASHGVFILIPGNKPSNNPYKYMGKAMGFLDLGLVACLHVPQYRFWKYLAIWMIGFKDIDRVRHRIYLAVKTLWWLGCYCARIRVHREFPSLRANQTRVRFASS